MRAITLAPVVLALAGCIHTPLSGPALDRVTRPAFISRIEENAGPRSRVFRDDNSYGGKLKKLSAKEADRRLQLKLDKGIPEKSIPSVSRFEVADQLRATTLGLLPRERPWTSVINPAAVASALESFLVEEVPANPPDYELLRPLGADAVVEFVVEEYGMRSVAGRAGVYVSGYARMFFLEGGGNIWRQTFHADEVESGQPHVDPFRVAKDPGIFREHLIALLKDISAQLAQGLEPPNRTGGSIAPSDDAASSPDVSTPAKIERPAGEVDDLPAPD